MQNNFAFSQAEKATAPSEKATAPFENSAASFEKAAALYKDNKFPAAFLAFTDLAEQGDARAQTVLALMYKFGEGTPVDAHKSFFWYKKAAEQGYAPAQFHTGKLYAEGLDTDVNLQKAEYWFREASKQGFEKATNHLSDAKAKEESKVQVSQRSWSKDWDFHLPLRYRQDEGNKEMPMPGDQYRVQVGAMKTQASANRLWNILKQTHRDLFKGLEPEFTLNSREASKEESKRTKSIYRIQTGPFSNFREADKFCKKLLSKPENAGCLAIKQN